MMIRLISGPSLPGAGLQLAVDLSLICGYLHFMLKASDAHSMTSNPMRLRTTSMKEQDVQL